MIDLSIVISVRDGTDLTALVAESVDLKQHGRSHRGRCPFCATGDFHVNAKRGFFHCFGCKEAGGAIDFVMKRDGVTFHQAVRHLEARLQNGV